MKSATATLGKERLVPAPGSDGMEICFPDDGLLAQFEHFYQEAALLKAHFAHYGPSSVFSLQDAQHLLLSLLLEQENKAKRPCVVPGVELYRAAQRIMACLADEIFSDAIWPQGAVWPSLEAELFPRDEPCGLAPGGPCLKELDLLLRENDPAHRELAIVYFYAFTLRERSRRGVVGDLPSLSPRSVAPEDGALDRFFAQSDAHSLAQNNDAFPDWVLVVAGILLVSVAVLWPLLTHVS